MVMEKKDKNVKPVTVHITNHNKFEKGVGAFITNLNHLTIVMDSEGNMKLDTNQAPAPVGPHTEVDVEKEQPKDNDEDDDSLALIKKCFKVVNDFVKEKVETVVNKHYQSSAANMALIEVTLFDHNLLKKRNAHTPLLRALVAWGIIDSLSNKEMKKAASGMAVKMHSLPTCGYGEWDGTMFTNDKKTCTDMGKELGPTIPYCR